MRYGHWDTSHLRICQLKRYECVCVLDCSFYDGVAKHILHCAAELCLHASNFLRSHPLEVIKVFVSGFCLPPPPGCPRGVYLLMVECW